MKNAILLLVIILFASSCKVKEVFVTVPEIHTEYKNKIQKDSIYLKDSIYIHQKGDTIYSEKFSTKYVLKHKTDTVLKNDTVIKPVIKIETKKVNVLHWWQKTLIWIGILSIIAIFIFIYKKSIR